MLLMCHRWCRSASRMIFRSASLTCSLRERVSIAATGAGMAGRADRPPPEGRTPSTSARWMVSWGQRMTSRSMMFFKLPDVTRPGVLGKGRERPLVQLLAPLVVLLHRHLEEVSRQARDVLGPLSQGWHQKRQDVDPVVEVLTEAPLRDLLFDVLVGRGDDPNVHSDQLVAPDPLQLPLLQDPQKLRLHLGSGVPDLVHEQRAGVRLLELALAGLHRRRERPLLVTEELALDQLGGNGGDS